MWMNWLWSSVWTSVSVLVFCYNLSPHSSNLVTELWLFVHSMSASGSVCAESVCNWCGVQAFSTQAGWTCNCDLRSICNLTTPWGLVVCDIHTQYSTVPDYHLSIQGEKNTNTLYNRPPLTSGGVSPGVHHKHFRNANIWWWLEAISTGLQTGNISCPPVNCIGVSLLYINCVRHSVQRAYCVTYMLVLAVEVSHSPARPIMSRPEDNWLKKRGWPKGRKR